MAENVHGHVILEHIIAAGGTVELTALTAFASEGHGTDATYYTCSESGMSFDQLLSFLSSRQKVQIREGVVTVFQENMCRHQAGEDHHHHA